ncbi:MAG TPA: complement resistance protein TraT [Nitrospiraceae bacterium]|nr:complement resistance protein TraT [Nitrospiraceae bacterium]
MADSSDRLTFHVFRFTSPCFLIILYVLTAGCSNVIRSGLVNSNTIFLEPSTSRTVYLQPRNVSENQQVNLRVVGQKLAAKGYQLAADPEQANYWIQTKVIYCHKSGQGVKPETVAQSGFGSGISTGGSVMTSVTKGEDLSAMMGGMDMNAIMRMAMSGRGGFGMEPPAEEGVTYLCVADVQITDRRMGKPLGRPAGMPATGGSAPKVQQMRMVGHVLQKDLDIPEATPIVQEKISTGISGLF